MKLNFRQGIVSHQTGDFLEFNISNNINLLADNRPVTLTIAQKDVNYTFIENSTVTDAWTGPFQPTLNYWLYWEFNPLTFNRTFGISELEPIVQSVTPGQGNTPIEDVIPGSPGIGAFVVSGYYLLPANKTFAVINSTGNDGTYTVISTSYDGTQGQTTIIVDQEVLSSVADGTATLDIDSYGIPLLTTGRMWYNNITHTQYVLNGTVWQPVLRVLAAMVINGNAFISQSIYSSSGIFAGTQIGNEDSIVSGRVLFDESGTPVRRDDGTFFTTEDQFFANASRVDAIRLESNIVRAQSNSLNAISQFSVIAYTNPGKISVAQYNDVGNTVVGILTEDLLYNEVGNVVLQGIVTNPLWDWISITPVGSPLWVENGSLTHIDPHVSQSLTYPIGQVPVARVLSADSVIFEQGLGGKGDTGPAGSIDNLPPASTSEAGAVVLVTPSSSPTIPYAISDTDPRLTDSRIPLPHVHSATDISFSPAGGISSNNVQGAIEELGNTKVNRSGDTLSGFLTLHSNPVSDFHPATKQYVDGLVNGLLWIDPIRHVNLIADDITDPSTITPEYSDVYIVPTGAVGAWTGLDGRMLVWDGTIWREDITDGLLSNHPPGSRFGISMESVTSPSGSFAGRKNQIAILDDPAVPVWSFYTPSTNEATYVNNEDSFHAYHQYVFDSDNIKWVEFGGGTALTPGINLNQIVNKLNVVDFSDGGTIDAMYWQGLEPSDLSLIYAPASHTHDSSSINFIPYLNSPNWGNMLFPETAQIVGTDINLALKELMDKKASKSPSYLSLADLPLATTVEGMIAYVQNEGILYYAAAGIWTPIGSQLEGITTTDVTALGVGASGYLYDVSIGNSAGAAFTNNNTGNVAVGYSAMKFSSSGTFNVAIGNEAGKSDQGNNNVFIGAGSKSIASGISSNNVAIGTNSFRSGSTGSQNVCIGYSSGDSLTSGQNNVLIGAFSGSGWSGSMNNRLLISSGSALPLIYGEFDTSRARVVGNLGKEYTYAIENYTANRENIILCYSEDGSDFSIFLPKAMYSSNLEYTVKKFDSTSGIISIIPYGDDTIDGESVVLLKNQYDKITLFCDGTNWHAIVDDRHQHNLPVDLSFFIPGNMVADEIVGSFLATREIFIPSGAVESMAYCEQPILLPATSVVYDILHNGVIVGSISYDDINGNIGVVNMLTSLTLVLGDRLQIKSPAVIDEDIKDMSITIVGCQTTTTCSVS